MSGPSILEWLTAAGTVGAAIVAAFAVVMAGRQGRAQQRQSAAERRADFELGVLLDISRVVERLRQVATADYGSMREYAAAHDPVLAEGRALLLALPSTLLPSLRSAWAPRKPRAQEPELRLGSPDGPPQQEDPALDEIRAAIAVRVRQVG